VAEASGGNEMEGDSKKKRSRTACKGGQLFVRKLSRKQAQGPKERQGTGESEQREAHPSNDTGKILNQTGRDEPVMRPGSQKRWE